MEQSDFLTYLIGVFDRLGLGYFIAGSIATSYYGEPRFTNDIDVIVKLSEAEVSQFCQAFPAEEFYLSEEAVQSAVTNQRQFNILHPTSGLKADIFVLNDSAFEQSRFSRRERLELGFGQAAWFAKPEDVILKKLVYYEEGSSEKHIRDILGVLKVQKNHIDFDYLTLWAARLDLNRLWQDVLAKSRSDSTNNEDAN